MLNILRIRKLLEKVPKFRNEPLPSGISDVEIISFTNRTGISIPNELQEWLKLYNGAWVGPGGFFGIRKPDPFLDIESNLNIHPSWKENKWIPISADGCGNYYVIATQREFGDGFPVVFIETLPKGQFIVASGLSHFLEFLLEEELNKQDPLWPRWPFEKQYVIERDPEILSYSKDFLPWELDKKSDTSR